MQVEFEKVEEGDVDEGENDEEYDEGYEGYEGYGVDEEEYYDEYE